MTNDPMSGVSTHLTTNIKECYAKVLAQSHTITELLLEGQYVDWKDLDLNKFRSRLDSIKVVLKTTKCTKDIGKRLSAELALGMKSLPSGHKDVICCLDIGWNTKAFSVCTPVTVHVGLIMVPCQYATCNLLIYRCSLSI